jgi:hypothetical protein
MMLVALVNERLSFLLLALRDEGVANGRFWFSVKQKGERDRNDGPSLKQAIPPPMHHRREPLQ